jgi:hypothetical protein
MTLCRLTGEPRGPETRRRTASMSFFVLGSRPVFFTGVRSTNSVCRPLQVTGLLPSVRRACASIVVTRKSSGPVTLLFKPAA